MSYAIQEEPALTTNDYLRQEHGWTEVYSGLGRILLGYLIIVAGSMLAGALVGLAVLRIIKQVQVQPGQQVKLDVAFLWFFYLGLGIMSLVGLFGYGSIVIGYGRCLLNVPERCGARWLLFISMTCLLMGPALNVVAGFSMEEGIDLNKGAGGLANIQFTPFGVKLQIAGTATALASLVSFMLFLRAIAQCFLDKSRASHVLVYLIFLVLLVQQTLYLQFGKIPPQRLIQFVTGVALGWLIGFLWYLYLIASMRLCILNGLSQVKSPLAIDPAAAKSWPVTSYFP